MERPRDGRTAGESRYGERRPASGSERSFTRRPAPARSGGSGRPPGRFAAPASRSRSQRGPELVPSRGEPERMGRPPLPVAPSRVPPAGEAERFGEALSPDLVWGRHAALATLESGRPVHRIWCTAEMRFSARFLQLLREAKASGVLVEEVSWARLGQISSGAVHQGIVLQTAAAETLDLPSLIEACRSLGEPPLLVAVDGLTDPHNLGAIVRSAEALGAHGLVLPQRRNAGLTGTVAKVAAGGLESLPVARVVNLNRSLASLKQEGYRVIGLASEGGLTLAEANLDGPLVVVTGSEAEGLSLLTRRSCDQLVRIPLRGSTPSLNASVATAVLLYEIARRGWMDGITGSQPAPRLRRPAMPSAAAEPPPAAVLAPPLTSVPEEIAPAGELPPAGHDDEALAAVDQASAAVPADAPAQTAATPALVPQPGGAPPPLMVGWLGSGTGAPPPDFVGDIRL